MAEQTSKASEGASQPATKDESNKASPAAVAASTESKAKTDDKPAAAKTDSQSAPAKAPVAEAKASDGAKAADKGQSRKSKPRRAAAKPVNRPNVARKSKSASKPAITARKPARAGTSKAQGATIMNKQTKQSVDAGLFATDQFRNVFGDVNARAKSAADRSAKMAEEMAELTRGNVEALVASSKIAAKGVETLGQDAAEYSRRAFEEASATLKSFTEVKSATDFFKLQSDYARSAFDSAVAESARMSETVLKLAGDVAEPITSRYTVAAERVKTLAA